jgi:multidrug resistance efflux pump
MREGVSVTVAHVLEAQRDARITAAQLAEARAKLALLKAGSREEDLREAEAKRNAVAAELDTAASARLDQCTIRAPVDGVVSDVLVNLGRLLSLAVPEPLLHMVQDDPLRVRAEVDLRDLGQVCDALSATVSAEPFSNASIRVQVASISRVVNSRTIAKRDADTHGKDVISVTLNLARDGQALPIGMPVTVRFGPC